MISPDWAEERISDVSTSALIKRVFGSSKGRSKTRLPYLFYCDLGTGALYEKIKERLVSQNAGSVWLGSFPVKIIHDGSVVKEVIVASEGREMHFLPARIISSIPVTEFVSLLDPKPPEDINIAAGKLKFRSHVSLFVGLDMPYVFQDQWIYLPEKTIPFGRAVEARNFSQRMSPSGKTSLLLEFFCWENDALWNATERDLLDMSFPWLSKLWHIQQSQIINYSVHREKYAYPVYDICYRENLQKVLGYLEEFKNVRSIGRSGCFKFNGQHQALESGISVIEDILKTQ